MLFIYKKRNTDQFINCESRGLFSLQEFQIEFV